MAVLCGAVTTQAREVTEESLGGDTTLIIERNVMVPMRDGVKLATDIYRHKIRPEISSSNYPQFERNSNTGGHIADEEAEAYRKATNRIHHTSEYPSRLILPVIER